ncbi:MAG: c-type cytochrome [Hyphomicrobiales bacterium]
MKRFLVLISAMALGAFLFAAFAGAEEAKTPKGQEIFLKYRCNSCHTIASAKIEKRKVEGEEEEASAEPAGAKKKQPPDLSDVGLKQKPDWFKGWILRTTLLDGKKHMKRWRGTDEELADLTGWLATLKTETKAESKAEMKKDEAPAKDDAAKKDEGTKSDEGTKTDEGSK